MSDINKDCQITNNSGVNTVLLDVPGASDLNAPGVAYEKPITILTSTDASQVLANTDTKTFVLDDLTPDPDTGNPVYSTFYELIAAAPTTLFPIKNHMVPLDTTSNTYTPQTVSSTDSEQMNLAYQFYQTIQAFVSSALSENLITALDQALQAQSVDEINNIMTSYFQQNTTKYQTLDILSLAAIVTYIESYACVWAKNQTSYTYYLYVVPSTVPTRFSESLTPLSTPPESLAPVWAGNVIFSRSTVNTIASPTDYNSGYSIVFQDPQGITTPLYYDGGQLVSSVSETLPAICIQPVYTMQSTLTYVETDVQLIPLLFGIVNGQKILGVDTDQSDSASAWYSFWNPEALLGASISTAAMGSIIVVVIIAVGMLLSLVILFYTRPSADSTLIDEFKQIWKDAATQEKQAELDRLQANDVIPPGYDEVVSEIEQISEAKVIKVLSASIDQQAAVIAGLVKETNVLAKYDNTNTTQTLDGELSNAFDKLINTRKNMMDALATKDIKIISEIATTSLGTVSENNKLIQENIMPSLEMVETNAQTTISEADKTVVEESKQEAAIYQNLSETAVNEGVDEQNKEVQEVDESKPEPYDSYVK